jgi:hypothetical protein
MKPDLYTKAVLTVIALMLTVIACNQYVSPAAAVQAQGSAFTGVQYGGQNTFFDTRTGDLWNYQPTTDGKFYVQSHAKLTKLGADGTFNQSADR